MTEARGAWLNAAWGFAEGTLFFVVPDVAFTYTTLWSPRRGWQRMGAAIAGALLAGAMMYVWASTDPAGARATVAAVPFLGESIITPAERRWDAGGTAALFANPLNGVPYKVYAVLAPERLSLPAFLLVSVPLRAERMILPWVVFAAASWWLARRPERTRRRDAIASHAGFWILVYSIYWTINWDA